MTILRAIGAVLAGALTAFVLGAIYEYVPAPDPAKWQYLYPWLMGGTGLVSCIVAIAVFYPAVSIAANKAALRGGARQPAKQTASSRSSEVPGMPKFDFEAAKKEIAGAGAGTSSAAGSSPAPTQDSALPSAPLSSSGSRPAAAGSSTTTEGDKL